MLFGCTVSVRKYLPLTLTLEVTEDGSLTFFCSSFVINLTKMEE